MSRRPWTSSVTGGRDRAMQLPQMARQVLAMSGSDHLPGSRQVLVHHTFHQMAEVRERHAATWTRQPLIVIINRVPQT